MEHLDGFSIDDYGPTQPAPPIMIPVAPPREKTKRPQLSCNPCRARKVKCDRIQPCTACSLHQIAEICQYDLSESERQPILQAEALKEKDKAIAHLQHELSCLRGDTIKSEPVDDDFTQKGRIPPRTLKRSAGHDESPFANRDEFTFYGHHGPTNVADEFAHLTFDRLSDNVPLTTTTGTEIFAFHMATSHPFPTLWNAKDDTSSLIKLLPSEEDLHFYIDAFQRRCQASSFPLVPNECTHAEVQNFLMDAQHNAALRPDHLALLFATLALGLQDGVYDRCGEKWVSGSVESESKKGDVYIAAAMQSLRLSSFLNRPTLLAVETLMMIGPYLTNSGKFLDASALFGGTIRLAQSIGLHNDPESLTPRPSSYEISVRKSLWWWMIHMDQQFSMTLGRPLGISSMGDCPSPEPQTPDVMVQSLSNYLPHFSLLGRQIFSSGPLNNTQIDKYSDDLLALQRTIPDAMQFDVSWLNSDKSTPAWPFDAQAALLHSRTHNLLILLNRQRVESTKPPSNNHRFVRASANASHVPRGRERVLESCRSLLTAFEFIASKARAALMCWDMGQMAFNAAMLLTLSMLETGETQDLLPVQHIYSSFLEINKLGIHKLAGAAVDRLGTLMKEFPSEDAATQTVMGQKGMILLEDHGLPGTLPENAMPLHDQIVGGSINASIRRTATDIGHRTEASHLSRKRGQRKQGTSSRDGKSQHQRSTKKNNKTSPRCTQTDRRFSDSVTPVPSTQRRKLNRSTPSLNLLTQHPGQSVFSANSTPTVQHELFMPQTFEGFPTQGYAGSPEQTHHGLPESQLQLNPDNLHPALHHHQQQQQQQQQHQAQQRHQMRHPSQGQLHQYQQQQQQHMPQHHQQQPLSEPVTALSTATGEGAPELTFSNQTTPYSSEFFDDGLPQDLVESHLQTHFDGPPFSGPSFPMTDLQGGFNTAHY